MSDLGNSHIKSIITGRGQGTRVFVLGAEITIKIGSADTGGAFTVFEGDTPPLHGPPLHRHADQDEWWYIVDGEFRFEIDGQELLARTGDTVFAPRGSIHTFQNIGSTPGRTLTRPSRVASMSFFRISSRPLRGARRPTRQG
jgi:mannose-6-phosphate isomerase-like protein (cupin superfamily)